MKIEKIKSKLKKAFNRVMGVLLPVATLFVSCGTNALVVHAATSDTATSYIEMVAYETWMDGKVKEEYWYDIKIPIDGSYEVVGRLLEFDSNPTYKRLSLTPVKNGKIDYTLQEDWIVDIHRLSSKWGEFNDHYVGKQIPASLPYMGCGNETGRTIDATSFTMISGQLKIFTEEELNKYLSNGGGKYDIIKPDTIDDGIKDSDIGYLHNLHRNHLQSGKQDENGIYENYSVRFTWDDTYPEYDSSYLIEVRGKCSVQTKGFLGLGKVKTYTSDIENIAKDISYNDLEWIISTSDQYAPFNSFINEHMPTNLVMTGVYGMRDYYFRIYKWSEADDCYHYGSWVNLHYVDDDLWISNVEEATKGDFDEDGNFIVDPDSDYGTGTKGEDGVGIGDTEEDAKKDNDKREEEKKNDDGKLDLSNSSLTDIWNWFTTSLWNLYNSLGFIPEFFQKIFSFLPTPIYVFLGIGIVIAIVLRVLGR